MAFDWNTMGIIFSQLDKLWQSFNRDSAILLLGLDNAGKTAILYSLKLGEKISYTVPTIGFNLEEIQIAGLTIKMWDLGGQTKLRELWPHYFGQSDAVIFVIDSNDTERLPLVKTELHVLMSHKELNNKPFLILANKQDLPRALHKDELSVELGLDSVSWLSWKIVECSATQNNRAKIGVEWLSDQM